MTNNRPASRMTLANSLGSAFRKDLNAEQVDYLIAQLLQQKLISEKGNKLIYHLS
jgi:transcriptional regulator CtsR